MGGSNEGTCCDRSQFCAFIGGASITLPHTVTVSFPAADASFVSGERFFPLAPLTIVADSGDTIVQQLALNILYTVDFLGSIIHFNRPFSMIYFARKISH